MYVASQVALGVKNLPANTEDLRGAGSTLESRRSLEDGMAAHSSPSLLCSLQNRPMNLRDEAFEARKMNLFGKPADQERWHASASKQPSSQGLNARLFYR